jgi:adenosylhomocysteinase
MFDIKDIGLAKTGRKKLEWVIANMPLLGMIEKDLISKRPFEGIRISLSVHMEAKTAYLVKVLRSGGADIRATGSNPLSTQDDVAAALAEDGIEIFTRYGCSDDEYTSYLEKTLAHKPHIIIDDGGDLVNMLHSQRKEYGTETIGGCEETTTGITRLRAMERQGMLKFPMIAVNNARCKYLFDNRYGTGQSVFDGIDRTTNLIVAGKNVVIAGYGWCGKGVAMRAKGLGARVIVTEVDPVKAMEAYMDGFMVMTMDEAAGIGDIFITVTGCCDVINAAHFIKMKDGAIMCNAGHFNVEIAIPELEKISVDIKERRKNITGYLLENGRCINLLAEGRLVNLAAGDGHPAEIMDMSFALQVFCALYLLDNHNTLGNKVIDVPGYIDEKVAMMKLESWELSIDKLTEKQEEYLNDWK